MANGIVGDLESSKWYRKHWIELTALIVTILGLLLLRRHGKPSTPQQIVSYSQPDTSGGSGGGSGGGQGGGTDLTGILDSMGKMQQQESEDMQAMTKTMVGQSQQQEQDMIAAMAGNNKSVMDAFTKQSQDQQSSMQKMLDTLNARQAASNNDNQINSLQQQIESLTNMMNQRQYQQPQPSPAQSYQGFQFPTMPQFPTYTPITSGPTFPWDGSPAVVMPQVNPLPYEGYVPRPASSYNFTVPNQGNPSPFTFQSQPIDTLAGQIHQPSQIAAGIAPSQSPLQRLGAQTTSLRRITTGMGPLGLRRL